MKVIGKNMRRNIQIHTLKLVFGLSNTDPFFFKSSPLVNYFNILLCITIKYFTIIHLCLFLTIIYISLLVDLWRGRAEFKCQGEMCG